MIRTMVFILLLALWIPGTAQDLVITNARILDGAGAVIEQGSIAVKDQRIVSISVSNPEVQSVLHIDARGMTVMPGFIDTHRHLFPSRSVTSDQAMEQWLENRLAEELQNYLAAGITTIMSTGDYFPAIMDVRRQTRTGELEGPRLLVVGSNFSAPDGHPGVTIFGRNPWGRELHVNPVDDPAEVRARVEELADAGVDAIKVIYDGGERDVWPRLDEAVLAEIMAEAEMRDLPSLVHVHGVEELLTAVELGAKRFVHTPYRGSTADTHAGRILREASIPISTTVGIRAPVVSADGVADITAGAGRAPFTPLREAHLRQTLGNVRQLWDEGVIVAFGTDTAALSPSAAIAHEILTLSQVLSPEEIIKALTINAALFLDLGEEIGTLEPGKLADILIIDGDPLSNTADLANVSVVIQAGRLVVDNR